MNHRGGEEHMATSADGRNTLVSECSENNVIVANSMDLAVVHSEITMASNNSTKTNTRGVTFGSILMGRDISTREKSKETEKKTISVTSLEIGLSSSTSQQHSPDVSTSFGLGNNGFSTSSAEPKNEFSMGLVEPKNRSSISLVEPKNGFSTSLVEPKNESRTGLVEPKNGFSTSLVTSEPKNGCSTSSLETSEPMNGLSTSLVISELNNGCSTSLVTSEPDNGFSTSLVTSEPDNGLSSSLVGPINGLSTSLVGPINVLSTSLVVANNGLSNTSLVGPIVVPRRGPAEVGAFTVQCALCFKWRIIPTKKEYEEIRECVLEKPWVCERALSWRPGASCADPADVSQDASRLWAIDKPNIPCSPPGWKRLVVIRSEGSSRFADIYYQGPSGSKLRSLPEVERFLAEHPEYVKAGVNATQFSFVTPQPLDKTYVRKRARASSPITGSNKRIKNGYTTVAEEFKRSFFRTESAEVRAQKATACRESLEKVLSGGQVLEPKKNMPLYRLPGVIGLGPMQPLAFFHPSDCLVYRVPPSNSNNQHHQGKSFGLPSEPSEKDTTANYSASFPAQLGSDMLENNKQIVPLQASQSNSFHQASSIVTQPNTHHFI